MFRISTAKNTKISIRTAQKQKLILNRSKPSERRKRPLQPLRSPLPLLPPVKKASEFSRLSAFVLFAFLAVKKSMLIRVHPWPEKVQPLAFSVQPFSSAAACHSTPEPIFRRPDAAALLHCARRDRCEDAPPTTFAIGRKTGPHHNPPRRPVDLWSARLLPGWGSLSQVHSTARSMGVQISGNTSPRPAMNARNRFCKCGLARCRQFQVSR